MRSIVSLICLLLACLVGVEAFFPYKVTHETAPTREESMANYIQKGFTFTGSAGDGHRQAKMAIKKRALPPNTRAIDRSTAEIHYRHAKLHARSPSNVERNDKFNVASAPAPSQTNSLTILDDGTDYSYFATVTLGSKNKEVQLLLDSGAADTWVMGSDCTTKSCETHTTYGPADSSTLKELNKPFSFTYGSGKVSGSLVADDMSFAGHTVSLTFGTASTTSDTFEDYPMDGILGLGRDASNAVDGDTFMETVAAAKIIPAKQFGMSLQRESDGSMYGEINFGAPDTSKYDGDLHFTDTVSSESYWEIPCDDLTVDGKSTKLTGNTAIIDSGTTYILIPPADAKQLHGFIPGAVQENDVQWNIPCNTDLAVDLVFSGVSYSISPKDYVGSKVGDLCLSNILGQQGAGPDQWIVGDVFMKNVYTLFDFDQARIGFGVKGGTSSPSSAAPSSSPSTAPASPPPSSSSRAAAPSSVSPPAASTAVAASSTGASQAPPTAGTSAPASSTRPILLPPVPSSTASATATSSGSARASTVATPDTAGIGASSGAGKLRIARVGLVVGACVGGWLLAAGL